MSSKNQILKTRLYVYTLLFLLNIIELTTYGGIMLLVDQKVDDTLLNKLKSVSTTFYLLSTVVSQLFFNLFSQIPLVAGPISETSVMVNDVMTTAYLENKDKFLVNGLVAIFLATLIYSLMSFVFIPFAKILRRVPLSVSNGIMVGTGITQFQIPLILFKPNNTVYICICVIVFIIFYLEKRFLFNHLSLGVSFLVSVIFYFFKKEDFYAKKVDFFSGINLFTNHGIKDLDFKVLIKLIPKIFSISLFCLLQLPVNLLSYESFTKKRYNFSKELRTQGITNLLCSLCLFPVYFICPYSCILFENGLSSIDAFCLVIVFLLIFPILNLVLKTVPYFVQSFFPLLIGCSMCYEYTLDAFDNSYLDLSITLLVALISIKLPIFLSFLIGIILCYLLKLYLFLKHGENKIILENKPNFLYIKIQSYCLFDSVYKLDNIENKKIVIEFVKFYYFDMNCRNVLFRLNEKNKVVVVWKENFFDLFTVNDFESAVLKIDEE
ncbi:sulfate permease [Tubulinosema ratisbonensis]|uniref:Sulfate permease n=1 Tax=Tubulinosema ratisbonensis TaxID=291195 RepID=A0A437AI97_9MICR|nr:sulfate permease [Tubulinosema ratisbonensis]